MGAPTYDPLVIKHHRREQSMNAPNVASRNARWQADQERNAESCERATNEEDYEIVQSKNVKVQGHH